MTFDELYKVYQTTPEYCTVKFAEWCYQYGRKTMKEDLIRELEEEISENTDEA